MKELRDILREAARRPEEQTALATVVRTTGSSYRRPGARMLIAADGTRVGALSGGCLEDDVAARAAEVLRTGEPCLVEYDTRALFGCHGAIEIFIERLPAFPECALLRHIAECFETRRVALVATTFAGSLPNESAPVTLEHERPGTFVHRIEPPIRLLIAGDGDDARPLANFAAALGWETALLARANELTATSDARTAAVIMTHNFGRDLAFLRALLPQPLGYIGLLGPRRRRERLLAELAETWAFNHAALAGLHSPAGLDIGAESPEEVALSIVGEIQAVLAARAGGFLRARRGAIHAESAPAIFAAA